MIGRLLTTLLALLLALAAGIALGGGPLSQADAPAPATVATTAAPAPAGASYADTLAAAGAPRLYADGLQGQRVAVVALDGAAADTLSALTAQIEQAGGRVAGTVRLAAGALDPGGVSLVDSLGSQIASQIGRHGLDPAASAYPRLGGLLGLAVAAAKPEGKRQRARLAADRATIVESLEVGGLSSTEPADPARAGLVLVVLGTDQAPEDPALDGLLGGLATKAPVVVAGDAASGASGQLARLRAATAEPAYTTVDGVDGAAGQVTTTLALIRARTTPGGAFGAAGADGAVPLR